MGRRQSTQQHLYKTLTSADTGYLIKDGDPDYIFYDTTGGDITVVLPTVADNGGRKIHHIKIVDANTVTIDGEGAETVNGQLTIILEGYWDSADTVSNAIEWFARIISGLYWREYHADSYKIDPGGSGATKGVDNATIYWLVGQTNEYLYFGSDAHSDWDGKSDIVVQLWVSLNFNEDANDDIKAEVRADYYGEHDNMLTPKTQTLQVDHDIVADWASGTVHSIYLLVNYDLVDNVVEVDDILKFRFRLYALGGEGEVGAVRLLAAHVFYRATTPAERYHGPFPVAG